MLKNFLVCRTNTHTKMLQNEIEIIGCESLIKINFKFYYFFFAKFLF